MALYLYKNGTKSFNGTSSKVTTPSLCYYQNNAINYLPLITRDGTLILNGKIWSYTTSIPTFHVIYNSTEYVVPNKYENFNGIPAGTYSPSTFEKLIKSFISNNGSRTVKNSFSVEVNGQTYKVSSGRAIYYTYQYGGQARFVCFNGSPRGSTAFQDSGAFAKYGVYCTYWSYTDYQGDNYYKYNIKVNTGINFK